MDVKLEGFCRISEDGYVVTPGPTQMSRSEIDSLKIVWITRNIPITPNHNLKLLAQDLLRLIRIARSYRRTWTRIRDGGERRQDWLKRGYGLQRLLVIGSINHGFGALEFRKDPDGPMVIMRSPQGEWMDLSV